MRWIKVYVDDFERQGMAVGIEKFGTGFPHDVFTLWGQMARGDGFELQSILLTEDSIRLLAGKFRVSPDEAMERIRFMSEWGFCELKQYKPAKRSRLQKQATRSFVQGVALRAQDTADGAQAIAVDRQSIAVDRHCLALVVTSRELQKRRDEWSKRKLREGKNIVKEAAPESLQSVTGVPHAELPRKSQSHTSESELDLDSHSEAEQTCDVIDVTGDMPVLLTPSPKCASNEKSAWQYSGVDRSRIPAPSLRRDGFEGKFEKWFEDYKAESHYEDNGREVCMCAPEDFLETALQNCRESQTKYPKNLLARKTEIDRANGRPPKGEAS